MKKCILNGILFVVLLVAVSSPTVAAEYPWEIKKDEDGIRVSVRKVEGSSILEYKGTVVVDSGPEAVVRLFEEDERMPEWFHQCSESRLIRADSLEDKVLYFVISMPWPVQDRDLVFRRVRSQDTATGAVEYRTSSLPEVYPEQDGKVRMPYLNGFWRFTPLGDGRTEIYYQQHSEVGGHIPAWLVNKLAVNIPFNSLSHFRQLLLKSKD
jgi:START domain